MEWFVYRLRSLALFDLLELVGRCTVLVVAIFWVLEADNRAKERHYRAWDLINSARGSTSDGGRRDALQDLNKDHVSLAGAPLEKAFLIRVDLKGADLMGANLEGTYLVGANLERTSLGAANLEGALLIGANLKGADLRGANLEGADLVGADLEDADLQHANLQRVNTSQFLSHLDELDLSKYLGANLNLQGANLWDANLQGANLASAGNLTQKQLDRANGNNHTQLPKGLARPARWSK